MKLFKKGFTLIELLIVVAIIAILAAIAVPNFLEAQVRAKVSRAKADMRTIATGIEAYAVDNGKPIMALNMAAAVKSGGGGLGWPTSNVKIWCFSFLTSPVSYLTSIPDDPFREKGARNLKSGGTADNSIRFYEYNAFWHSKLTPPASEAMAKGYQWALYSIGPMRNSATGGSANIVIGRVYNTASQHTLFHYDPSNGTVSQGYILRTNKGDFTGPQGPYEEL